MVRKGSEPALPITVAKVKAVVAQLKHQHYMRISNMLVAAKGNHLEVQPPWTEFLAREAKRATRSGTRGRGGVRQDEEIDVGAACCLGLGGEPLVSGGSCCCMRALGVGSFHILRETELSLPIASSVDINRGTHEETFFTAGFPN